MKHTLSLLLILLPLLSYCQHHTCADLKNGTVYARSAEGHEPYRISIDGSSLIQTNLLTGDSTVWSIHWVNDCGFIMKFLSGTPEYYLYTAYRDRIGHREYAHDTLWVHQH